MAGRFSIAVIGGDGIGPEVIDQAIRAADAAAKKHDAAELAWDRLPWSTAYYKQHGRMLPENGWEVLKKYDAILFGAVGSPDVPDKVTVHQLLLPMRRVFDQYVNLRPAYLFDGVPCPLVGKKPGSIDMLVYRENTEGEYAPVGGHLYAGTENEIAVQTGVFTRRGCDRILRAAFDAARKRPRKKLTSITKSNAQVHSMGLWDEVFFSVRKDYPDVDSSSLLVDAAAMDFVRKPESFDVVVASNLFGDILTDLSAAVTGSIGLASSANINPTKKFPSMFEPVHGSAPDIAGKGIANPLAAVLSAALMLTHLGLDASAAAVRDAVSKVLAAGAVKTPDLGGTHTTTQMGDAVVAAVRRPRVVPPENFNMLIWAVGWACLLAAVMVAVMLVVQTTGVGRHERYVRAKGTPITAWVMQASKALYEPGLSSTHAHVLYTFDDTIPDPPAYMRELVARLAKLKGTRPDDKGEAFAARLLADESYRPFTRAELPRKLTGGREVYYAHIWVERELLPSGVLDKPFVRAIAVRDDDDSRALMEPYPAEG